MKESNGQKNIVLLSIFMLVWVGLGAEFVVPDVAANAAQNWLSYWQPQKNHQIKEIRSYKNQRFANIDIGQEFKETDLPQLYLCLFNNGNYVVVPADDNAPPVLAYSSLALKDANDMPPAFEMWMKFYADNVNTIRTKSLNNEEHQRLWQEISQNIFSSIQRTEEVSPLLKTNWDQDWPYNELCPADLDGPGGRVYAGCVATAMAQLMKFWNKPITGQGNSTYYAYGYGYQSVNHGNTTYLWDDMPNSLSGSNLPVATLIYHAAVSVEMGFAPDGSGSNGVLARNAFVDHFNYASANYLQKQNYSTSAWESILRTQLDNGVPLYYSGSGETSGHAFNCDGYQGTNYFHFNFGWSGSYNGYFYLNDLSPGSSNFPYYQAAIVDAIPAGYTITEPRIQLEAYSPIAGDEFPVTLTTYPLVGSWNVNNVQLGLFYEHSAMEYIGYDLNDTIAPDAYIEVVNDNNGTLNINLGTANPLIGTGNLIRFNFRAIEPGNFYFGQVNMTYNGQFLQNVEPLLLDVIAPVETLDQSSISLVNVMHVGYNQLGAMIMNTTYIPPSWGVTSVDFDVHFDSERINLENIICEETLIADAENIQITPIEPGVVHVSCETILPLCSNNLPLMKLNFRAIGNTSSVMPVVVTLSDFYYNQTLITDTSRGIFVLSAVSANEEDVPLPILSVSSYPNPFNPTTTILLNLPIAQTVEAAIFNLKGQRVFNLHNGTLSSGEHRFIWNGVDQNKNAVGNGVYLLRIDTETQTIHRKLSLMK
ncbi:MAG: C10 family peptidase [Candidatus Cloacimonetes bacterium]|nr:C10 family peptidase [Candidatus Cloacimonadota bacterium]